MTKSCIYVAWVSSQPSSVVCRCRWGRQPANARCLCHLADWASSGHTTTAVVNAVLSIVRHQRAIFPILLLAISVEQGRDVIAMQLDVSPLRETWMDILVHCRLCTTRVACYSQGIPQQFNLLHRDVTTHHWIISVRHGLYSYSFWFISRIELPLIRFDSPIDRTTFCAG